MNKLLSVLMVVALSACGSAPIKQAHQGLLKGSTDVSISFQNNPELTGARFNMTGYTKILAVWNGSLLPWVVREGLGRD